MPGTVVFRPLQANLKHDLDFIGKMNPYCKVKLGKKRGQSSVCRRGGKHPCWDDTIVVERNFEPGCEIVLKDKNSLFADSRIGACKIDLEAIEAQGRATKWFDVIHKDRVQGQLLVEISYVPSTSQSKGVQAQPLSGVAPLR